MQMAAHEPAVRLARRRSPPPSSRRRGRFASRRRGRAASPRRCGQDRRGPDREVAQGGLPPRPGLDEGSGREEGHPLAADRPRRQDGREHARSGASFASRSERASRSARTTSWRRSRSRRARLNGPSCRPIVDPKDESPRAPPDGASLMAPPTRMIVERRPVAPACEVSAHPPQALRRGSHGRPGLRHRRRHPGADRR